MVQGRVWFAEFLPVSLVELGAIILLVWIMGAAAYRLYRWYVTSVPPELSADIRKLGFGSTLRVLIRTLLADGLGVRSLYTTYRRRWLTHFLVFYGFIGLMATTTAAYVVNPHAFPMPLSWPVRILGNMTGIMVIVGSIKYVVEYYGSPRDQRSTIPIDPLFVWLLLFTTLTGFMTQAADYAAGWNSLEFAYGIYSAHLVLVIALLGAAPLTRFMHALTTPFLVLFENYRVELEAKGLARDYKRDALLGYTKRKIEEQGKQ